MAVVQDLEIIKYFADVRYRASNISSFLTFSHLTSKEVIRVHISVVQHIEKYRYCENLTMLY